jgi:hypothetical protein
MSDKDERGRFLPGNRASVGIQRNPKVARREAQEAIERAAPGEKIEAALNRMHDLASQYGSWKAYEAWLTMVLAYQLGKPTIKIERVEGDPISAALDELRRIHADKQPTYTVIDANIDNTENAR